MTARRIATALAAGRIAFGVGMFAAPGAFGRGWIGADARVHLAAERESAWA